MKIAFGSCNRHWRPQDHWNQIALKKPDLWIWLGDMVYADLSTIRHRERIFQGMKENEDYKAFCEKVPVIGTWDDHDYAYNNKDGSYRSKAKSKELVINFLGIKDQDMEKRSGIYQSYTYRGKDSGPWVKVVLLDLRYNQDKKRGKLLGEEQWEWFNDELKDTHDILIVGSSLNTGYGWHKFPAEQRRLYYQLQNHSKHTIVLSGDRHMAEICRLPVEREIIEVMSSGLTHNRNGKKSPHAMHDSIRQPNFGLLDIAPSGFVSAQICSSRDGSPFPLGIIRY